MKITLFLFLLVPVLLVGQFPFHQDLNTKKYMAVMKKNKVKSVKRYQPTAARGDKFARYHEFDKNGFLIEFRSYYRSGSRYTMENNEEGKAVVSYTYKEYDDENWYIKDVNKYDRLGNIQHQDRFHLDGELFFTASNYHYREGKYRYFTEVENGEDSTVTRVWRDTMLNISYVDYLNYEDGTIYDIDSYYSRYDSLGKKVERGRLDYNQVLMKYGEEHPEELRKNYGSSQWVAQLILSGKFIPEMNTQERYQYNAAGQLIEAKDQFGHRRYYYLDTGFIDKIEYLQDNNVLKSVNSFIYNEQGLLLKESEYNHKQDLTHTCEYEYQFFE